MEEIEKKVFEIIGRSSKLKMSKHLGLTRPTLDSRLKNGGWLKCEIDIIDFVYKKLIEDYKPY